MKNPAAETAGCINYKTFDHPHPNPPPSRGREKIDILPSRGRVFLGMHLPHNSLKKKSLFGRRRIYLLLWFFRKKVGSNINDEPPGFPLKDCGNDRNISHVLLLMVSLVTGSFP